MRRRLFFTLLLAIFAQGCAKEDIKSGASTQDSSTIEVGVMLDDDTRTYIGTDGKIHWAASGEKLGIVYYADDNLASYLHTPTHDNYSISDDGRITFTADITTTNGAAGYTLGAYYPYSDNATSSVSFTLPRQQSPAADSYDPNCDVLVARQPITTVGTPSDVDFTFARMVAFAKMTLKGIGVGEIIEEVTFSSSAKPAGTIEFDALEDNVLEVTVWNHTDEDIVIRRDNWVATGEDVVWMTTLPTDLSGADFTVTVVTDKNTYTKSVDLSDKSLNFERADVAVFTVAVMCKNNFESIAGDWQLTEWRGVEPGFDVYISITEDGSVSLWQRIESREWKLFNSTVTYNSGVISGTYTDGVEWSASYSVTVDGDNMTWVDTADNTDVSVYSRCTLPDFGDAVATRSEVDSVESQQRFL